MRRCQVANLEEAIDRFELCVSLMQHAYTHSQVFAGHMRSVLSLLMTRSMAPVLTSNHLKPYDSSLRHAEAAHHLKRKDLSQLGDVAEVLACGVDDGLWCRWWLLSSVSLCSVALLCSAQRESCGRL